MLGSFTLRWNEHAEILIPNTTTRALLAYLIAYRERPHTRDLLSGLFWPDLPETLARRRLTQALWQIRRFLAPHPVVLTEGDTVRLDPALPLRLDVAEFEQYATSDAAQEIACAVALYRGEFLNGYYDDWLLVERERLRELFLVALERLIVACKAQGDYQHALTYARRLVAEDPWRESAHCEVMRLYHLLGQDAEALKQYQVCRQILADELGVDPAPETQALATEIVRHMPPESAPYLPSPPPEREIGAAGLPLVGREEERAALVTHLEAALNGLGGLVLIEGEAGVGKTRLLRELARDAGWRGMEVLWGSAEPLAPSSPYAPLANALTDGLSPLRTRQLTRLVEHVWLQVLAPLLPPLRAVLPDLAPPPLEPLQEQARLAAAVGELLRGWAHIVPLLLIIEDVHWADADTLALIPRLLPALVESRVLVVGSYRSGESHARPEVWQALQGMERAGVRQRLALPRLDAASSHELLRYSLGIGKPAPLFEARLFAETDGNPLFLLETLRTLHSEGLLFRNAEGQWCTPWDESTHDYAELPLPQTVEQIIARRLNRLSPSLRPIVHLSAVLGERFDFDLLCHAADVAPQALLDALHELVRGCILEETATDYRFHHDKIRQVVYHNLAASERIQLHRQVAETLEMFAPEHIPALAHHWEEAAVWDKAAAYHRQAGDRAQAVYANREAIFHYTHALEALSRLPEPVAPERTWSLHLAREAVYALLGERTPQLEDLMALETLTNQLGDDRRRVTTLLRYAEYYVDTGDLQAMRRCLDRALTLARAAGDRENEAAVLGLFSCLHHYLGDLGMARQYGEQALAMWRNSNNRAQEARCLASCTVACLMVGDFPAAEDYARQALALCRSLGNRAGEGHALYILGRIYRDIGLLSAARDYSIQALDILHLTGERPREAYRLLELGNLHANLGEYTAAQQTLEQAAALFQQVDEPRGYGYALLDLGLVRLALGHGDAARDCIERGRSMVIAANDRWGEACGLHYIGLVLEELGDLDAAAAAFRQSLAIKCEIGRPTRAMEDQAGLARIALAQGRRSEARQYVAEMLDRLAQDGIHGLERPFLIYSTAHQVLAAAGETSKAQAVLAEAYALLMERANRLDDEATRRLYLENVAENRAVVEAYRRQTQKTVRLPRADAPLRRALRADEYVNVTWTVAAPEDEAVPGKSARRQHRLLRLLEEAAAQGAAPTVDDLAAALDVSIATLKRDLETLRRAGKPVQTRGSPK